MKLLRAFLIYALALSQVMPPSAAWALRGQPPTETGTSAGLEEALITQPVRGFATRVGQDLMKKEGIQTAARAVGPMVAGGSWDIDSGTISEPEMAAGAPVGAPEQAAAARQRTVEGVEWLAAHQAIPAVADVMGRLQGRKIPLEFRANHGMTLDLSDDDAAIRIDTTVSEKLETEGEPGGRRALYGLGLLHEAAQAAGYSTRASIHLLIAAYESLSTGERQQLRGLLDSPYVDHGGIWDFFFRQVVDDRQFQGNATRAQKKLPAVHLSDEGIRGVDTLTLMERRDAAGASAQERDRLDWVIDYRDTWVSWLTGMLQFDIPFDYQKFMQIYRDPTIDLDTKRQLLFEVLRGYSKEAERENAGRVARDAAERGQILIGGRYSTAFVDEANEVASAEFVVATDELREAALALTRVARETNAAAVGDRDAESAAEILERSAEGLMTAVLKSGGVTRGEVMRYLDIEGHVGEVYGALEKCELTLKRSMDGAQAAAQRRYEMEARVRGGTFDRSPFDQRKREVEAAIARIRGLADAARDAFLRAPRQPYARMVALQRPSPTGAINFAHGIGFAKKAGQAPNLRERVRTGGQNSWMSPDTAWVEWINYMVEFIPLFIGERVLRYELPDGRQVERREVEVDQQQLEVAIRGMADPFAVNIERTMTSEYAALAREAVCELHLGARVIDALAAERKVSREEAYRLAVREAPPKQREKLVREIAAVAAGIAARAEREAEGIEQTMVETWAGGPQTARFDILRRTYLFDPDGTARYREAVAQLAKETDGRRDAELLQQYEAEATEKRRPLPMWIMGTTEAPGLTESFCMGWLEEEMALRNVVRAKGHENDVDELLEEYRRSMVEAGRVVLREFGYERQIDARSAEQGISEEKAVLSLVGENEVLQREVAKLAVLRLWAQNHQGGYQFSAEAPDVEPVLSKLGDAQLQEHIDTQARQIVWLQNRSDLQADVDAAQAAGAADFDAALRQVIESKQVMGQRPYEAHFQSARRWVARDLAVRELDLQPEAMRWYRDHTALARTTARQTVVDRYNLRAAMTDPRNNYQSDGVYLAESDSWAPSPWKMRYLIAAGPSQVDLGGEDTTSKQLKSISLWPKWGGVVSQAGEDALRKFYGAYHYRLEVRRLDQAEDMKVLKNSRTAMGRAVMNLISAVTTNDVQDVAIQTRTHGDPVGDMFAYQDPDKPGASAGYCIPKDILFKVFVSQLQDAQALRYIGISEAQVPETLALIRRVWASRVDYASEIEWERWATGELIALNESFKQYVDLGGRGVLIFNVTRIAKVLDRLGVPSAYPGGTQDLYRGLVASVAAERIADLESVNRIEAFRMPVDLLRAIEFSRSINAGASLTPDGWVTMQMPAPYKGTGRGSQLLADVRYSRWLMAAYLMSVLPGVSPQAGLEEAPDLEATAHRLLEPLTASLRPQDEALFHLGFRGFRPESENPADRMVTRFVAERLMGITRRSVETLPGFVEARQAIPPEAPDYLDRLEALVTEWIARTAVEDPAYAPQVAQLRARFQPRVAPGRITITASPQTAVADVMGHITEKELWDSAADEALAILQAHGLTLQEIQARAKSGDPFPVWIAHLPVEAQRQITEQVGGRHIPLAIREGGLGTNFWKDIQGKDVVVLGVPYDANLNANPAHIIQSMRRGNPGFLGVISDHAVQGRPRLWHGHRQWAPDVMLAYAAGLAFDKEGQPITDWTRRPQEGRRVVYVANSLPAGNQISETWRTKEMEMEGRSIRLYQALQAVATARKAAERRAAIDRALEVFRQEVPLSAMASEYDQVRSYEREVGPDGLNLFKERDRAMTASLGTLLRGMNEAARQRGDPALWLGQATRAEVAALGLMFLLNGETQERIDEALGTVDTALAEIRKEIERRGLTLDTKFQQAVTAEQAAAWTGLLIEPQLQVEISGRSRQQVEASSVKAPETVNRALAARAALVLQAEREVHLARRGAGYRQVMEGLVGTEVPAARWDAAVAGARQEMGAAQAALGSADPAEVHTHIGRIFAWMQTAGHAAVDQWVPDAQERLNWHEQINTLTRGRDLNEAAWNMFVRLHGLLPRLFELAGEDPQRRAQVGALMEMAHAALALEKMSPYLTMDREYINEPALWLDLLSFFGVTINDHFAQRLPWAFSPARGNGFQELFNAQERLLDDKRKDFDLYDFAWDSHAWLYGFLRQVMVSKTQLADMPQDRRDQLLGVMTPQGASLPPIGGGAPAGDTAMQLWHGYLQLREIGNWCQTSVAMLQDTFRPLSEQVGPVSRAMMPYVFDKPVDPALIHADSGAGLVIMSGVGRPHYQQLMREGADPDLGDNVFITQHGRFLTPEGRVPGSPQEFDRASLWIDDAHFWVPLVTFREMLMKTEGMSAEEADAKIAELQTAKQIHPKGVRVAARFSRPVAAGAAVTLHGHYIEPQLQQAGYPTVDKSGVLFDVTYGKIYGPEIVAGRPLSYPEQGNIYQGEARDEIVRRVQAYAAGLPSPAFFVKGSRESGSRNLQYFDAVRPDGSVDPAVIAAAAEFACQVSTGQDVVLSNDESLRNSNQTFLTPQMAESMRNRAVREFGVDVNLNEPGKADVTTVRVTVVSPRPDVPYEPAHVLAITSYTGRVTNMARQNVAEPLLPEFLQPEIRDNFLEGLMNSAPEAMRAMADFARRYWHEGVSLPDGRAFPAYKEVYRQQNGEYPKEFDARGVPYWYPTWLMLDYIPSATFASVKDGQPLPAARIVDVDPGDPRTGAAPVFTLQDGSGNRIQGRVTGHVPWLLEWNTGIGQIPEYNRREQHWEYARARGEAARAGDPENWFSHINWGHVGVADRKALKVWLTEARETRAAKGFPASWPEAPVSPSFSPAAAPPAAPAAPAQPVRVDPLAAALRGARSRLGAAPLTEETLSLWLSAYVLRRLAPVLFERRRQLGDPESYEQAAGQVTSDTLAILQEDALRAEMAELIEEEGIPVSAERLAELLQGSDPQSRSYRERIALRVLGDVMADPQTVIPVAVLPRPLDPETVAARLTQPNRLAVVVGKELRMDHAVEPFALSAIGRPVDVLGVHADWVNEKGEVTRVQVYDPASRVCWECPLTRPMRLPRADNPGATPRAYIVDLPQQGETERHAEVTRRLRAGGIEPVNPAGQAQARADDKAFLLSQSDAGRVHWNLLPRTAPSAQVRARVSEFIGSHPGERLVIRPRAGTTGAEGVRVIDPGPSQADQAAAAISALLGQGHDVILERFWGNVTMGGREFVVRSNVSAGEIQSGNALVAPFGERVVSTNRGAVALSTEDVLDHLIGPAGAVAISPERMAELDREAVAAAQRINQGVPLADRLGIVALDRRFWVDGQGQVHQVILEANARGGGLIAAEPSAVAPSFWLEMGLAAAPSLIQWETALTGPQGQQTLQAHYPPDVVEAKQALLQGWMRGLADLRAPGGRPAFDVARSTEFTRTPGRAPLPPGGRHMDYLGFMGGSLGLPTLQEVCTWVQVVDGMQDGVEVYAVDAPDPATLAAFPDEGKGPRVVSLDHPWLNPDRPIRTLAEWDEWAGATAVERRKARSPDEPSKAKLNHADDLVSALIAFLRTDFGDSSGRARAYFDRLSREGKGLRIAIASDLPAGGGLSSSSAVLEGAAQAFNEMAGIGLDVPGLVNLGYAERFYAGTQGGVKDHAHFMYAAAYLGVAPTRLIETLPMVPGVSLVLLDSGISRDNAPQFSAKLQQAGDDEQNIKGRTGIGYALGALWIRHSHPELAPRLRPNEDPSNPYGFLRELMPGTPEGLTLAEIYGLLREIPAEGMTREQLYEAMPEFREELDRLFAGRPAPPRPYALREMTLFGFAEEARSIETVRVLRQLEQGVPPETVFQQLLEIIRTAHNGDRVAQHVITAQEEGGPQAQQAEWDWRLPDDRLDQLITHVGDDASVLWRQPGALERSIEPIDRLVDTIARLNGAGGGNLGAALIIGAGLGGTVEVLWSSEAVPDLLAALERDYYEPMGLTHTPAVVAQPGMAASVFTLPHRPFNAGLEEAGTVVELAADVSPDRLNQVARVLSEQLRLPTQLLEPSTDGEFYPVSPKNAVLRILIDLIGNIHDHLPTASAATARVSISVSQERVNDHLNERFLNIRYRDENPERFEVSIEEALARLGVTSKQGPGGNGLYMMRKLATSERGGVFTIEATGPDGNRQRLRYDRVHGQGTPETPGGSRGVEIAVAIPAGVVGRQAESLAEVAGRIRGQLAGLEESTAVRMMFEAMPRPSEGQDLAAWREAARQAPGPGLAAPALAAAQKISSHLDTGSLPYARQEEDWDGMVGALPAAMSDLYRAEWAAEVLGHLARLVRGPPGQERVAVARQLADARRYVVNAPPEVPPAADPLSPQYDRAAFVIASPAPVRTPEEMYVLGEEDPRQLLADVQAGRRPTLRPKTERVASPASEKEGPGLWANMEAAPRALLAELYGIIYDIRDYDAQFTLEQRASRVIELLHHENQGVAAAARDVIVNARIFGLDAAVGMLAEAYRKRAGAPGPYAGFYYHDALTTRVDPVHKVEYGSPERNIFAGEMTGERFEDLHEQVKLWVDPKNKLSLFTGSGQRMVAPILTAEAGFKDRGDGRPTGFPDPDLVGNDIGSQPHDAVLVTFGLVAKMFVENMRQWREEKGLPMPDEWTVAIGSDGRSTTGAITQVAARVFRSMGVKVKMTGITSAPEAAARAYFSGPEENLLATFEITPSHINQAFIGTKLMLWMGQILPWKKAEEFNKRVQAAAQDPEQVRQVLAMLQDPDPAAREEKDRNVEEDLRRLPEEYGDSRRRYYAYLKRSWTGNWAGDEAGVERDWRELKGSLRDQGVVGVLDLNGGARMTDLPLFDDLFEGRYIVMAADAGSYHHSLPPGRTTAKPMMDFLERITPVFQQAGLTLLPVIPDPDGDRKAMVYRRPGTGEFLYLDPQAGYMLDSMALVMAAREDGIQGIGIVSNSAGNPGIRFVMHDRLGAEVRFADVGEANVVQAIENLIMELANQQGIDLQAGPGLSPQEQAAEIRKRLAGKVSVGGGEPPAAAFIQGVMVRDMAQAFGTMFWFYRKPEWVKGLIESLVDDPARKAELIRQVETLWYLPEERQYLTYRIVHEILPPMWSADPGDKTEKVIAVRPEDQRHFKNVLDRMLVSDGPWVAEIRKELARIIGEETNQTVLSSQITVSEPVNFNEEFEVQDLRGDRARTLPDGRFDPTGGYAVNLSYQSAEGIDYLVGTLWIRGSKTDVGVTRVLPLMVAPFLPPEQGDSFSGRFRDAFHPLWTIFNYAAEAEELRGHVEGRFTGPDLKVLEELAGSLDSTLGQMRLVRNATFSRHVEDTRSDHYSHVDEGNMGQTDAAALGAVTALGHLCGELSATLAAYSGDPAGLRQQMDAALGVDLARQPVGAVPAGRRQAAAYRQTQGLVAEALRWKVERHLPATAMAEEAQQGVRRLTAVLGDLSAFAAEGTTAQAYASGTTPEQRNRGTAYANLALDKIVLARELEFARAAGLEEGEWEFQYGFKEKSFEEILDIIEQWNPESVQLYGAVSGPGTGGGRGPLRATLSVEKGDEAEGLPQQLRREIPSIFRVPLSEAVMDVEIYENADLSGKFLAKVYVRVEGAGPGMESEEEGLDAWFQPSEARFLWRVSRRSYQQLISFVEDNQPIALRFSRQSGRGKTVERVARRPDEQTGEYVAGSRAAGIARRALGSDAAQKLGYRITVYAATERGEDGPVWLHVEAEDRPGGEGAGLEEGIALPAGAMERKVVFLTPEVLTPGVIGGLARLRPAAGERLGLVVFGENAFQLSQVELALGAAGLRPDEVINVQEQYGGVLAEAVADRQVAYFSQGLSVQVVYTLSDLTALGKFLRIPEVSLRAWQEEVTRSSLGVQA